MRDLGRSTGYHDRNGFYASPHANAGVKHLCPRQRLLRRQCLHLGPGTEAKYGFHARSKGRHIEASPSHQESSLRKSVRSMYFQDGNLATSPITPIRVLLLSTILPDTRPLLANLPQTPALLASSQENRSSGRNSNPSKQK